MNRLYVVLTLVASVALSLGAVRADGVIVKVPKDGAWATFDMHQVKSLVDRNTGVPLFEDAIQDYALRVSAVGQATVEGKPCCWLEIKLQYLPVESRQSIIWKVLIPEEHLKKGGDPTKHIVRGWVKVDDEPIAPIEDVDDQNMLRANVLPRAVQDSKELAPKVVDCKAGKLKCIGLSGTTAGKDYAGREFETVHEIRLHDKSPFGVASWYSRTELHAQNELDDKEAGRMTIKVTSTLRESGTNAKSELPDHN